MSEVFFVSHRGRRERGVYFLSLMQRHRERGVFLERTYGMLLILQGT